jgi:hypothetical protein
VAFFAKISSAAAAHNPFKARRRLWRRPTETEAATIRSAPRRGNFVSSCVYQSIASAESERERDSPQPTRRQQAGQRVSGARRQSQPARALESHQPRKRMPCRRRQCTRRALQQLDIRAHRTLARRQQQQQQQPTSQEKTSLASPAPATVRRSDRRTLAGRCPAARKWSASASSPASSRPTTTSNTTTAPRPTFGPRDTSRSQLCPSSPSTPTPGRYVT